MSRAQEWQTRLTHEGMQHERSSFLTLTYSDDCLPSDAGLHIRDVQLFMKRLRFRLGHKVRFFACGEYGDRTRRPHYHLILFGEDFPDKVPWRKTGSGHVVYRSKFLETIWTSGHAEIGTVTPDSAGYVARYCLKKVNGPAAEDHYTRMNPVTGEIFRVHPEFITMSSRPGIGADWYREFAGDAFPSDFVIIDGQKRPVPRYYLKKLGEEEAKAVKDKRVARAERQAANNSPERLAVREEVVQRRVSHTLIRELDQET